MCRSVICCIHSKDYIGELLTEKRTEADYDITDCIKDFNRVISICVLTPIFRFMMSLIKLDLKSTLRCGSATFGLLRSIL